MGWCTTAYAGALGSQESIGSPGVTGNCGLPNSGAENWILKAQLSILTADPSLQHQDKHVFLSYYLKKRLGRGSKFRTPCLSMQSFLKLPTHRPPAQQHFLQWHCFGSFKIIFMANIWWPAWSFTSELLVWQVLSIWKLFLSIFGIVLNDLCNCHVTGKSWNMFVCLLSAEPLESCWTVRQR